MLRRQKKNIQTSAGKKRKPQNHLQLANASIFYDTTIIITMVTTSTAVVTVASGKSQRSHADQKLRKRAKKTPKAWKKRIRFKETNEWPKKKNLAVRTDVCRNLSFDFRFGFWDDYVTTESTRQQMYVPCAIYLLRPFLSLSVCISLYFRLFHILLSQWHR